MRVTGQMKDIQASLSAAHVAHSPNASAIADEDNIFGHVSMRGGSLYSLND